MGDNKIAKLQEYEFRRLGQQAIDFHDDVRDILNNGKVAHSIVSGVPAWKADNGEMVFYDIGASSTDRRIYVRLSSSWVLFAQLFGNGAASNPGGIEQSIQYNSAGNAGPVFGGDKNFLWNSTGLVLNMSGTLVFVTSGAAGANGLVRVTSNSNVLVGPNGTVDPSARSTISLGINVAPAAGVSLAAQLYAANRTGQTNRAGLTTLPEVGGPHYFGDFCGINTQNPTEQFQVNSISTTPFSRIGLSGSKISFGDDTATDFHDIAYNSSTINGPFFQLEVRGDQSAMKEAFLLLRNRGPSNITQETPQVVFGDAGVGNRTPVAPLFSYTSAATIVNHRHYWFVAPTLNSSSGSTIAGITNAATVFISGAPSGSSNITNTYALWVSGGVVRIDGTLLTGVTQAKPTGTVFTTTAVGVSSNNTSDTTLIRGVVGTTSLVANTLSEGRTIRLQARGYYNTAASAPSLQWNVKLGGTTVLTTGSLQTVASVSTGMFDLTGLVTCWTTGGAGTVYAQGNVQMGTGATGGQLWGMVNSGTVVINTTGANVVEVTVQWGSGAPQNNVTLTHCVGELLN